MDTTPSQMDLWKKLTLKVMFLLRTTSTLIFNLIRKKEDYEDIEEFEMISQLSYQSSNLHGIWKDPAPSSPAVSALSAAIPSSLSATRRSPSTSCSPSQLDCRAATGSTGGSSDNGAS